MKKNKNLLLSTMHKLSIKSRLSSYGDGFFESIRVIDGEIKLWDYHYLRILKACEILSYNIPRNWSKNSLKEEIYDWLSEQNLLNTRLKLTIYRKEGGLFAPTDNYIEYFIEGSEHLNNEYTLNKKGLALVDYTQEYKYKSKLNEFKSTSALFYVLAALYGSKLGYDEVILFNKNMSVSETSSANIFIVKNGKLYTPPVTDNCLNGVMRQNIIRIAKETNNSITEKSLFKEDLITANEIWISNAIKGIQWVEKYSSNSKLENKIALIFSKIL